MSETLGKFVIDLEARVSSLESDLGRAARISKMRAKEMQKAFEGVAENIVKSFGNVAAMFGASIGAGAFGAFIKSSIDAQDRADEMAQKLGITTEAASKLSIAAKFSATDLSGVSAAMVKLNKNASDAARGIAGPADAFRTMGISVLDANNKIKSSDVLLGEIGNKFSGWEDGVNKTALAVATLGKSGADLVPMLNDWNGNVSEAIKLAGEFGLTISSKTGAAAAAFNDNLAKMGLVARGVGNQIASALVPALNDLAVKAIEFFRSDTWKSTLAAIASGTKVIADNIGQIMAALKLLGSVAATVYAGTLLRNGAAFVLNLAAQLGGIQKLIVAQEAWGATTAKSFATAYKNIGVLGIAFNVVGAALVGWQFGTYLSDQFLEVKLAGIALVDGLMSGWERMREGAQVAWLRVEQSVVESIRSIRMKIADLLTSYADVMQRDIFTGKIVDNSWALDLANKIRPSTEAARDYAAEIEKVHASAQKAVDGVHAITSEMADDAIAADAAKNANKGNADALDQLSKKLREAAPQYRDFAGAEKEAAKAARKLAEDGVAMQEFLDKLAGKTGGAYQKAWNDYGAALDQADKLAKKFREDGMPVAQVQKFIADATKLATQQLSDQIDATEAIDRILAKANSELDKHRELVGMTADEQKVNEVYTRLLAEAEKELLTVMGPLTKADQKRLDGLKSIAKQIVETDKATEDYRRTSEEVARGWMSIWQNAGQSIARTFSDVLVNGGSLLSGLKNMAKQTVASIIEYFMQLRVINPLLNGIFGGSGGLMQAAGMAMMPTGSAGGMGQVLGSGMSAAGGGDFNLMSSQSWMTAGKSLFNGFDAASKASGNWMGTYTPDFGTGTYAPTTLGYAAAGVTGAYMGYSRWQNSNKDIGGGLGAAAYGVGGYSLAIGAGAAMSGGLAAGMAAIPVVGWIALAAMAVDYLSGGKLFGTKGKLDSTKMQLDVGAEGVNLAQSYVLKGQKAFFGGSKWSEHSIDPSADAKAAAQQFYDAILKNRDIFARQFNAQVGDLVGGSYKAEYDKKGNLKNESVTVLGHEYKGETQEDLGKRLGAENMIAVLTQFDAQLSKMAESYRASVDQITEFAQAATVAQGALQDGIHFLALGTDESASKIIGLADKTMILGESIDRAVQRIVQAQQAYDQFAQQFAPGVNYVDDFEASMSGLYAQMKANIKQANDLAKAAGAEGASAKDLANIHAYAAKQYAALRAQLEDSAKSLAYSMGLIGAYSLDQVNAEIAALQEKANQSSQSVTRFGDSMSAASRKANDAINLLLGNLSPLNDQEKLQKAMEGLRAGTVSQEQVLEIGRRLYASSQAYNDLFREVQGYGRRAANDPGYSAAAQQMASAAGGFTQADKERLADLLKQQQQMQAAQDLYNAQTLARQIAELSASDGVDFHEILGKWGLSADDLAARMHLDNEAQLQAWIESAQKQTDDNGENTTILAGWLEKIFNALVDVRGGPGTGVGTVVGDGNSRLAEDVATGIERGFERGLGPYRGRGIRPQVTA